MKKGIHPNYKKVRFTCSCGASFENASTLDKDNIPLEICGDCHPAYTGKSKAVAKEGKAKKFTERFGANISSVKAAG